MKISQQAITANTLKSAVNMTIWYYCFAYLNKNSIKNLTIIISKMVIIFFDNKFHFYNICVKVKMIK